MSKRFTYRIKREASYTEEVDAIIVAKDREMADKIAGGLGDGETPNWPDIERYNVWHRDPIRHELLELTAIDGG